MKMMSKKIQNVFIKCLTLFVGSISKQSMPGCFTVVNDEVIDRFYDS